MMVVMHSMQEMTNDDDQPDGVDESLSQTSFSGRNERTCDGEVTERSDHLSHSLSQSPLAELSEVEDCVETTDDGANDEGDNDDSGDEDSQQDEDEDDSFDSIEANPSADMMSYDFQPHDKTEVVVADAMSKGSLNEEVIRMHCLNDVCQALHLIA